MTVLESNIYALWLAKQTARGSAATNATKRAIQVAGDVDITRTDGSENYSDLDRFGDAADFIDQLLGGGQPAMHAQPDMVAYLCWLFFGGEVVTGGTSQVNSITSTATGGNVGITVNGQTATVPYNVTAAALKTALEALSTVGAGNVVTAGGPLGATPTTITFQGALANQAVTVAVVNTAATGGVATLTTTTPGAAPTHTYTPQTNGGWWSTIWSREGQNVVTRQKFNDCRFSSLQIEGSTAQKFVRATPNVISLDPGEIFTTDPTVPIDKSQQGFLYTEGAGAFALDGQVFSGQSQFQVLCDDGLTPVFGDDVVPFDIATGTARITLAATVALDAAMLAKWNLYWYGTASPAGGAKPLKKFTPNGPGGYGSYGFNLVRDVNNAFGMQVPGVKWTPPAAPQPNPDGGPVEVALAGEMRKVAGQPAITVTVKNNQVAYTA